MSHFILFRLDEQKTKNKTKTTRLLMQPNTLFTGPVCRKKTLIIQRMINNRMELEMFEVTVIRFNYTLTYW